jgi:antitoxin (DNA-binding transcriptional repressor) of toxin-antitoxin stability system
MRSVNIAELKNRLSTYITYAKAGETIVIRDRNTPVAQLIALAPSSQPIPDVGGDFTAEERELAAAGILRLPEKPWDPSVLLAMRTPKVKGNAGTQAILDDRNEGL